MKTMKKILNIPVQIKKIEIVNFKNVKNGKINFIKKDKKNSDENVIGLYGQNGSGKTTFVNAIEMIKNYISNEPLILPNYNKILEFYDYFSISEKLSKINTTFFIKLDNKDYIVDYVIEFIKNSELKTFDIYKESISYKNEEKSKDKIENGKLLYTRNKNYSCTDNIKDSIIKIIDSYNAAEKISIQTKQSIIFNSFFIRDYCKNNTSIMAKILNQLQIFARINMFVITNKQFGMINLQWNLPFMFRLSKNKGVTANNKFIGHEEITSGGQTIDLTKPQKVSTKFYEDLNKMFDTINSVLNLIIPQTKIAINANDCILIDGSAGKSIELVTIRNNTTIPMRNESTGILKIISILQTLITYCTFDDIFLAIDEFDAGIFEYLLGSLLELLAAQGKGQLFFTSHNLRPLEVLNKNCIYFSTTNTNNRYIKMANVKNNNNLRDFYLRTVELGGQKENLYNDDNMAGLEIILRRIEKNA